MTFFVIGFVEVVEDRNRSHHGLKILFGHPLPSKIVAEIRTESGLDKRRPSVDERLVWLRNNADVFEFVVVNPLDPFFCGHDVARFFRREK